MRRVRFHKTTADTVMITHVEYPRLEGAKGIRVRHPDGKVELVDFVPRPRYGMRPVIAIVGKSTRDALYLIGMKPYTGPVFDFIPESYTCPMADALAACWDDVSDSTRKAIVDFVKAELDDEPSDPADAPIADLRREYEEKTGTPPNPKWNRAVLAAKIAEG